MKVLVGYTGEMLRSTCLLIVATPLLGADPDPAAVDRIFSKLIGPNQPGCAVSVMRSGEFVFKRSYGLAELEHGVPITSQTRFYVASVAKQFTAAVALRAAEAGVLFLDEPVRKYVPELPPYADKITVRHLIHHTSGLRDYLTLQAMSGAQENWYLDPTGLVTLLSKQKRLNFDPGSKHEYTNSGYALLSIIVGRAAKKGFRAYADEVLFQPQGMKDTFFSDDRREVIPARAFAYGSENDRLMHHDDLVNIVGDGGLFSTVEDMLKWHRFLLTEPAQALRKVGKLNNGQELNYAFGVVRGEGYLGPFLAHGGAFKGYRAAVEHYPLAKTTLVCFCNDARLNAVQLLGRLSALYSGKGGEEESTAPRAPPSGPVRQSQASAATGDLAAYAGRYVSDELDALYELTVTSGRIRFRCRSISEYLDPVEADHFQWSSWRMRFDRNNDGKITGFLLSGNRVADLYFRKE